MDAAQTALLTAGVRVALAGAAGYGLYRLINVADRQKPSDWGRQWLSWSLFFACVAQLPSFFRLLDANSFAVWLLVSVVSGTVAFLIGWLYGKFFALRLRREGGIRPSAIVTVNSSDGGKDSSIKNITRRTSETVPVAPAIISSPGLAVIQNESSGSQTVSEGGEDVEQWQNEATWLVILGIFIWWKTSQTNFEYAIGYCLAYYFTGFCIAGVAWIFIRKKPRSWRFTEWLNYAAFAMVGVLVLSFILRIYVENSRDGTFNLGRDRSEQTTAAPNTPKNSPRPMLSRPEPNPQGEQLTEAADAPYLTALQVKRMQALLIQLGYQPGPIDGEVGPRTKQAISAFQSYHGLPGTGEPSQRLLSILEYRVSRVVADEVEKSDCVLKPVMTDADYRACGANPPSSY